MHFKLFSILLVVLSLSSSLTHAQHSCADVFSSSQELQLRAFDQHIDEAGLKDSTHLNNRMSALKMTVLLPDGSVRRVHEIIGPPGSPAFQAWSSLGTRVDWVISSPILEAISQKASGNMSMFAGDLFFDRYFVSSRSAKVGTAKLARVQPYLKWSIESQQFSIEWRYATLRIFSKLANSQGDLVLFRGVSRVEKEPLKQARLALESGVPDNQVLEAYKKAVFDRRRDAIFFAGSSEAAQSWSKDVVKISIPHETWSLWGKNEDAYAGIETPYVEVGLFSDQALIYYIKNFEPI